MAAGECECLMVNQAHVEFERPAPMSLRMAVSDEPVKRETMSVRHLEPGEARAVNIFGKVVIVVREP